MGCNCKKRIDKISEYADEPVVESGGGWLKKVIYGMGHALFGIIAFGLIIVMVVPFLLYLLFCLVTGTDAHVRYTKHGIRFGKKREKNG